MKRIALLSLTYIAFTHFSLAQIINFELIDPQPELQGSDTGDMEFADLDNDGDPDLIITGSGNMTDGTVHGALTTLYFNDGSGNFTAVTDNGIANIRVSKIGLADIDNDDDPDLLISGRTSGATPLTKLYRNDGAGNFTEIAGTPFESLGSGYFNFGDIDGDTDIDIIFSGGHAGIDDIVKYVNDGDGNFSLVTDIGVTNINGVLDLSDFDNDNDLDLLVAGQDSSGNILTRLYTNDSTGNFTIVTDAGFNNLYFGDIATGDTDGDEDLDVIISGSSDSGFETEFYINNGDGTFTWVDDAPILGLAADGEVSFNDFDNDGDLDVFVIGSADGGLPNIYTHIYENLGSNNFILSDEFIGGYLSTHAVADINGDNLLDLVIGGTTTGSPVRGSFVFKNVSKVLSINESAGDLLSLYPNPTSGSLQINTVSIPSARLDIYELTGRLITSKGLVNGLNNVQLSLPDGIYIATISNAKVRFSQKLIVKN